MWLQLDEGDDYLFMGFWRVIRGLLGVTKKLLFLQERMVYALQMAPTLQLRVSSHGFRPHEQNGIRFSFMLACFVAGQEQPIALLILSDGSKKVSLSLFRQSAQ